jgi:hypothetical protein
MVAAPPALQVDVQVIGCGGVPHELGSQLLRSER